MEVGGVPADHRQRDNEEQRQGSHLDQHQHRIDGGTFLRADHEKSGDKSDNDHGRQIDEAADLTALQEPPLYLGPDFEGMR